MSRYPFAEIEQCWQDYWKKERTFRVIEDETIPREKRRYVLDMFPYPSASGLHVGHPEGYTATDIYTRWLRMKGYHVLHPMGFDSFGLPAENFALKTGTHPAVSTAANIEKIREQIQALGYAYDWQREVSTCEPDYYRWTQWIFLRLYHKGLAYQDESPINWCQSCLTGLANEEVADGRCERCGGAISRRMIRQWMLRITDYAERLLAGLDELDWPESVKQMQRNWIGRSEGADVDFKLVDAQGKPLVDPQGGVLGLTVYTTRPDTLFGATYMVVAPEHPLLEALTVPQQKKEVTAYRLQARAKSDLQRGELQREKTGLFTGSYAINPVNGEHLPVWVADYVLISYGSGAIMAVPAHDQRDWDFAHAFDLPVREVLAGGKVEEAAFTGDGEHVNSGLLNGLDTPTAFARMVEWLEQHGLGRARVNYRLRDWVFSRQRYWGEPIPIVHCQNCGVQALPEDVLPLLLPEVASYQPGGSGESPLSRASEWLHCRCPECGGLARRETNTMPQWAGSCWYYLRYLDPQNDLFFVDKEKDAYWMPVDLYLGGAEHAVLHLLYARFWHHVLYDLGLVKDREPFRRLVNQGMILGEMEFHAFVDPQQNPQPAWVSFSEVKSDDQGYFTLAAGERRALEMVKVDAGKVDKQGERYLLKGEEGVVLRARCDKMSKSRGNVLNPDDLLAEYGADTFRMYEMFMGPLTMAKPWSTGGMAGVHRFLNRVWLLGQQPMDAADPPEELKRALHRCVRKVSEDTEQLALNTAIAAMMSFINLLPRDRCYQQLWHPFVRLLSPYVPHLAEELWAGLGEAPSIANAPWPEWDEAMCVEEQQEVVFQVNGKVRAKERIPAGLERDALLTRARDNQVIRQWVAGKTVVKEIVIPGRLVNVVVR